MDRGTVRDMVRKKDMVRGHRQGHRQRHGKGHRHRHEQGLGIHLAQQSLWRHMDYLALTYHGIGSSRAVHLYTSSS
jgi:hypothetical protein